MILGSGIQTHRIYKVWSCIRRDYQLYLLLIPILVYYIIFKYWPIYGLRIAFMDYSPLLGFKNSPWVGFKQFEKVLFGPYFWPTLKNTLIISGYSLATFPIPILFALFVSDISNNKLQSTVKIITVAPHFISMVVVVGMLKLFLSPTGMVNLIIEALGGTSVNFFGKANLFPSVYVWSGVWQEVGWSSIIYIAALSSVDTELHEAAKIDGASRWERVWNVDIPGIMTTIVILLILRVGNLLGVGFEKTFLMQTPLNIGTSEIIATYSYKVGLLNAQYSYSTAIGLFNSIFNFILLMLCNKLSKKIGDIELW